MYQPPNQAPLYQQQPIPPPQPRKKHAGLWIALGIIGGLIALVCVGCGLFGALGNKGAQTSTLVTQSPTSASTTATQQHFKVGETVKVNDHWTITLNSAVKNTGNEFNQPKAGNVFLFVVMTMKNISSQEQTVSSIIQFTLRDASGQKYNETINTDAGSTPDGKVAAGAPIKGTIVYEIPLSVHDYTFAFEDDAFGPGQTIWDVKI